MILLVSAAGLGLCHTSRVLRFAPLFALFATLLISSRAHAQEQPPEQVGRALAREGRHAEALAELSRAYELTHDPALQLDIAEAEEQLGRFPQAAYALERYLATAALAEDDPSRARVERRIAALRARSLQTSAPLAEPDAPQRSPAFPLLAPSLVSFGLGLAALVSWGVLGSLALAEDGALASGCGATRSCTLDDIRPMEDLSLAADLSLIAGVAAVTAGVLYLVLPLAMDRPASERAWLAPWTDGHAIAGLRIGGVL